MREFPAPKNVMATIKLGGGAVEVVAEERDTVIVDVQPYDDSAAARDYATNTKVELYGEQLLVESPHPIGSLFRSTPKLRVAVRLPLDSGLTTKVSSADVSAHGRYSALSANTASGDVYVEHVAGEAHANTASGDVRIGRVEGDLRANAASGDVTVNFVGGDASTHSASGDIEIDQVEGSVRANTASGEIRIGQARRGQIKINSASGDVRVGVATGTGVWLDLTTMSGSTSSDLPVGGETPAGGAQLSIQVRTMSGDIEVHRVGPSMAKAS